MSQEELHSLLQKLVDTNMASDTKLQKFKQLDGEYLELRRVVAESLKVKEGYERDKGLLLKLISQNNFDATIQSYEYPKRVLGGDIDLESASQKQAIDELLITLKENTEIPKSVIEITAALKKFYAQYFENSNNPPEPDQQKIQALKSFENDATRGGAEEYKEYLQYLKKLSVAEKCESGFENALSGPFELSAEMNAEKILSSQNEIFKKYLMNATQWQPQHVEKLELIFDNEHDPELLENILVTLEQKCGGINAEFLNRQIDQFEEPDIFINFLLTLNIDETEKLMSECIEKNYHHLLNLMININGFDQNYFYLSLSRHGIHRDVFKTLIDSLFVKGSAQGTYGMDGTYAEKVISSQKKIPINVVTTLQRALPRGFEGSPLAGYFEFMSVFNKQLEELRQSYREDEGVVKDQKYSEHKLKISDTEAIRFIIFTYIYDAIRNGIHPSKVGMSRTRINELVAEQYHFEKSIGQNANIINTIVDLFKIFPDFDIRVRAS